MTTPSYPVDLSAEAARAACDAYALLSVPDPHRTDPDYRLTDPATHLEAHVVRAALPYVLRDELARLVHDAFGDDYDGSDYHYALEALRDGVVGRLEELDHFVETASSRTTQEVTT